MNKITDIQNINVEDFIKYRNKVTINYINKYYPNFKYEGTVDNLIYDINEDDLIDLFKIIVNRNLFVIFAINRSLNPQRFKDYINHNVNYQQALHGIRDYLITGIFLFRPDKTYKLRDIILNINYDNYDIFFFIDGDNVKDDILPLLNNYNNGWFNHNKRVLILIFFRWDVIPVFMSIFMKRSTTQIGINDTIKIIQTYNNKKDAADVNLISAATTITNKLLSSSDMCNKKLFIITNDRFAVELDYILNDLTVKCMEDIGGDIVSVIDQKDYKYDKWLPTKDKNNNNKIRRKITTQRLISGWFIDFYKNNSNIMNFRSDYSDIYKAIENSKNYSDIITYIDNNYTNTRDKKILYNKYDKLLK